MNPVKNNPSQPEIIQSTERMLKQPKRNPVHLLYLILAASSVGCALWQHGHTVLTLSILAALPLAASLAYIPYKWYNAMSRSIVNAVYFGLILAWGCWRIKDTLPDKVLVEALSASLLIFLSTGKERDYGYLFFISIFLMSYGALVPRIAYLYIMLPGIFALVWILWARRTASLAGGSLRKEKKSKSWKSIPFILAQILIAALLFLQIFPMMPVENNDADGLFETSFLTERESALPPELGKWIKPQKVKPSDDPKAPAEISEGKNKPQSVGEKGTPMDIKGVKSKSLIEGNGSASQGNDLLFYVKSPLCLYHCVRYYDEYDGRTWRESARFKKMRLRSQSAKMIPYQEIEMQYTVEKLISMTLPSGFMPVTMYPVDNTNTKLIRLQLNGYEGKLTQKTNLPFSYAASVAVILPNMTKISNTKLPELSSKKKKVKRAQPTQEEGWLENLSVYHYIALPGKKISSRVRDLAKDVTKECKNPYEQAIALRDHLRNTYPYLLNASPLPDDKEAADYFLFELKTGHCEYFACALAVLARCVGLPARVVTGFSPGNYNTLNNLSEIYEYHAHAWTQIFIPYAGWLTMDATPPSAIPSETIPKGIGYLRDPFGDEWKITPPELTEKTKEFVQKEMLKKGMNGEKTNPIDSTLLQVVNQQELLKQKLDEKYEETTKKINKSKKKGGRIHALLQLKKKIVAFFIKTYYKIADFFFSAWLLVLSGGILLVVLYKFLQICLYEIRRKIQFRRMSMLFEYAAGIQEKDPKQAIRNYYYAFRLLLKATGMDRHGSQELLAFSQDLEKISQRLADSARGIFLLYYKAEYRSKGVDLSDALRSAELFKNGKAEAMAIFTGKK